MPETPHTLLMFFAALFCAGFAVAQEPLPVAEEAQTVETTTITTGTAEPETNTTPESAEDLEHPCTMELALAHRIALAQNPSLQAVGEKVEQAHALTRQARALYYPQIQARFTALHQWLSKQQKDETDRAISYLRDTIDDLNDVVRSLTGVVPGNDLRDLRRSLRDGDRYLADRQDELGDAFTQYTYGVNAQFLAFDGFARKHLNAVARFGLEETRQGQREARRLLLDFVTQAYLAVQLAQENLRVAESDRNFNQRLLEDAEAMMEYGRAPLSVVLNFEIAVKAAEVRHLTAEGDLQSAQLALARLLGLDDAEWPQDWRPCPLPDVDAAMLQPPDTTIHLAYALAHRPDLLQREMSVDRADAEKKRRQGAYYPQIGVMAGVQDSFNVNQGPSIEGLAPQVGFGVTYDIFTGGKRKAAVLEAEHARREAQWHAQDARLAVQHEVRDAAQKLDTAQRRYTLLVDTVRAVRQTRDLVEEEYRAGKESLTRLNQAQRDMVQADGQLAFAQVALKQAWHVLDTATAKSLEIAGENEVETPLIETKRD